MRIRNMRDAGIVIRDARKAAGMTQAELAARCHVVRQTIASLERGGAVSLEVWMKAVLVLDIKLTASAPAGAGRGSVAGVRVGRPRPGRRGAASAVRRAGAPAGAGAVPDLDVVLRHVREREGKR